MIFPEYRARRLRKTEGLRSLLQETRLSVKDFVYPLFVFPGKGKQEISSMPGIYRLGLEDLAGEIQEIDQRGIPAVILFGLPRVKDAVGSEAFKEKGIIQQAIQAIKAQKSRLTVICDLCLCEYTDHGHCGKMENGELDNDATLEILGEVAVAQARAGAEVVVGAEPVGVGGAVGRAMECATRRLVTAISPVVA